MNKKREYGYILSWAKKVKAVEMAGGKCRECGNTDIMVLQFHHNNLNKSFGISQKRFSMWDKISEEVKKCELLCANCHAELLYNGDTKRSYIKDYLLKLKTDRCSICGYKGKNTASLSFHHHSKKNLVIARHIFFAAGKNCDAFRSLMDDVLLEIEKCDVVCENCHKKIHLDVKRFEEYKNRIYKKMETHIPNPHYIDKIMVKNMYVSGIGICDIAKKIGCSKSSISYIVNDVLKLK